MRALEWTYITPDDGIPPIFRKDITNSQRKGSFGDLVDEILANPPEVADKKELDLWAPASMSGKDKLLASLEAVHLLVYDLDEGQSLDHVEAFRDLEFAAHTSLSHSPAHPKWRLILPLRRPIKRDDWPMAWKAGAELWRQRTGSEIDKACKNANRFYFRSGAHRKRRIADGLHNRSDQWLDLTFEQPRPQRKKLTAFTAQEKRRLSTIQADPAGRRQIAERMNGQIFENHAKGISCPSCSRPSIWFSFDFERQSSGKWATCNHRNTCGFWARVEDLC